MGKLDIRKSFNQKKFKYGGYAALLTMIVLAVVVAVNLVVGQLNLKLDLTKNKMFSLSEQSFQVLDNLKEDVKIVGLYQAGKESTLVKEVLEKYKSRSKHVLVEYVDPVLHPNYTQPYVKQGGTLDEGSLIVSVGNKFKTISGSDLYNYTTDQNTGSTQAESVAAEQKITNAIVYVTGTKNPVVYTLQGHDEATLSTDVTKGLGDENYTVTSVDLLTADWKPAADDVLLINSPKRDMSADELKKIKDFMAKGGKTYIMMDYVKTDMPNVKALLETYGVAVQNAVVFEGSTQNYIQQPIFLLPNIKDHAITSPISNAKLSILAPQALPIEEVKVKKSSLTIEPLLYTSTKAYAKKSTDYKTLEKEAGDITGPFNIAVAVTDKIDESNPDKTAKLILVSTSYFTSTDFIQASNGANLDLFMNGVNWLVDKKESLTIRPKSLAVSSLTISTSNQLIVSGLVVIVIPVIVAAAGISVWLRRRHL